MSIFDLDPGQACEFSSNPMLGLNSIVRLGAVGIQMYNGTTYIFGGNSSPHTSEFLLKNTNIWQKGPEIPYICSSLVSCGMNFLKRLVTYPSASRYSVQCHAISNTELILISEDCIIKGNSYYKIIQKIFPFGLQKEKKVFAFTTLFY